MATSFKERYDKEKIWHKKVLVMEIFHLTMCEKSKGHWPIRNTAKYFDVSIGLVSENLKLADAINHRVDLETLSRKQALAKIK